MPIRLGTALLTFATGARTAWHVHPAGQMIVVMAGRGWLQRDGGPVDTIGLGDIVFFATGERHWHGATAENGLSHLAITEMVDGKAVDWLDPVTDDQYRA